MPIAFISTVGSDNGQLFGPIYEMTPIQQELDADALFGPIYLGTLIQAVIDP